MLKIYDSLTQSKQEFIPIIPNQVSLYVCGTTTYDFCHIGHARTYVAFDIIVRYLRHKGYQVTYVRNITDIDDKIIERAQKNSESCETLTSRFNAYMQEDFEKLLMISPDHQPKATESIPEMIQMIEELIQKGFAYQGKSGDVYYDVSQFSSYGQLSKQKMNELYVGERIATRHDKKNPIDFVLWKMAKPNEPFWSSPWGNGRPGWHIECSAMTKKILGRHFDIHGGGADLQFPHHENEIAQSEAANGCCFAKQWIHTGMVKVEHEKMSKSLGNFFTIREVLANYRPESIRYFLLSSHYRSPLHYTEKNLTSANAALERLYTALLHLPSLNENEINSFNEKDRPKHDDLLKYEQRFEAAMNDDFNTPEAMAILFEIAKKIQLCKKETLKNKNAPNNHYIVLLAQTLLALGNILGLLNLSPNTFFTQTSHSDFIPLDESKIEQLIHLRKKARDAKNWKEADTIRQQLLTMHVILEDQEEKTIWRITH
jgi:cysteinyl-tRNA synthetase